ncbi:hypothetical protein F383_24636 [Gossypium arboreum]|uniref:Uncharacterized protein n=1 Tax=Gossypium arboreum TaxID=29729 RepID=A0A0B0P5A2_GOSAR|nr:hypothetical protein F383_24636 [Gossypium arboreum]
MLRLLDSLCRMATYVAPYVQGFSRVSDIFIPSGSLGMTTMILSMKLLRYGTGMYFKLMIINS